MVMMIVPHVVVVGKAVTSMVLVIVGSQLLIQVNGAPSKALSPIYNLSNVLVIIIGVDMDVSSSNSYN